MESSIPERRRSVFAKRRTQQKAETAEKRQAGNYNKQTNPDSSIPDKIFIFFTINHYKIVK
ncbi:hypothetical protein CE91St46_00110 [Eubacteriales bacterium]|nr:hypothetical protein CE91St46_00110 [Eubacteriales bacterium]